MTYLTTILLFFTSFFTLINPLGVMPVFLTMTDGLSKKERKKTATKAIITAFLVLLLFAILGKYLFDFFGISVAGLKVVGGVLFFIMGYDMLNARLSRMKLREDEVEAYVDDIAVTPLGIPMIAGPGAITNAMVLMGDANTLVARGEVIISLVLVSIVSLLILWGATGIIKFLGVSGNKILMKIMGLIVMVIAVEFFFQGVTPYVQAMMH
jgi:multiple antibiotic resistance protein